MDPVATHKQMSLVNTLKEMKRRPTFAEQWPDSHKKSFFNGRNWQNKLDVIRQEQHRIEDIYKEDNELYDWWTQIDSK
jgi:hypothetical protein